jgi:endonuclease-3
MKKADVALFFDRLAEAIPIPKGELEYINPYTLLVAVVLSAQATDVSVNKATEGLFKKAASPEAMLALGEARLRDFIKTIGLYNAKAKNVIALSRLLIEEHGGEVPKTRAALEKLPGVGRKTANVVLNTATAPAWRRARRRWRSRRSWSARSRPGASCTPITG